MSAASDRTLSAAGLRDAFLVVAGQMSQARDELCRLDAAAGDGDLGATLEAGFAAVREALAGHPAEDAGALLREVAMVLARTAPGTIGTLLATAFLRGAKLLDGAAEIDPAQLAELLDVAAGGVAERGRAEAGQRTVLDAMFPAAQAARDAADADGATIASTLGAAAQAARAGAQATAQMEPQHGRAGWIGERAKGLPDAGAAAWATLLEGLAAGVGAPAA